MADDAPYFLDFLFNDIVDVHWTSDMWLMVSCNPDANIGGQFNFIGVSGGSPGVTLPNDYNALPFAEHFTGSPLTQADIDRKYTVHGGAQFTGLAAYSFDFGGVNMWFGLKGVPNEFTVRARSFAAVPIPAQVGLYRKVKAGTDLLNFGSGNVKTVSFDMATSGTRDVDVNQARGTLTLR